MYRVRYFGSDSRTFLGKTAPPISPKEKRLDPFPTLAFYNQCFDSQM